MWLLKPKILSINSYLKPFITDITIINVATPKVIPSNEKNDIKEEINKPLTAMVMNFDFNLLFFRDMKNWKIEKNKDKQSEKFPKDAAIS